MKNLICYLLTAITVLFAGCSNEIEIYKNAGEMVSKAKASVTGISGTDFKTILEKEKNITIIDCRDQKEFIAGHIPGAINIPRGVLEFSNKISNRRVKLFIYSQTDNRATLAYVSLKKMKYPDVTLLTGGWEEWHKTFPKIIEEGTGTPGEEAPKEEESGGCGG